MKLRIATGAALAAVSVAGVTAPAVAAPAHHHAHHREAAAANATPGCVSWSEFDQMVYSTSRVNVEQRWGVVGRGVNAFDPFLGDYIAYPKCGYEKGFPNLYYYGVKYTNHEQDWSYLLYDH